jgi:hypothetical protein
MELPEKSGAYWSSPALLNAPLDNSTSLILKGDVLCTANLGFVHAKPEEADRTVVCMKGFPLPK